MDTFWKAISAQLVELRTATNADDVINTLNRYGPPSSGDAFFAGGGGDETVSGALREADWSMVWYEASYHWCMVAPDGSVITYVEGDIYRGDDRALETEATR